MSNIEKLNKDIQELLSKDKDTSIEVIEEVTIGTPMIDFFKEAENDVDEFDEFAWQTGEGFTAPSYPIITEKLEGFSQGLFLLAGPSNAGKSAMMMNIMHDLCTYEENNVFGVYFSLDDSRNEIIPRVVAMDQRIPISVVSKPSRYKNFIDECDISGTSEQNFDTVVKYEEYLEKRTEGLQNLKNKSNRFKIEDSTRCTNLKDIEEYIINLKEYLAAIDPTIKLVVGLDSINDVQPGPDYPTKSNNEKIDIVSKVVKHWTVKHDLIIFASTHLRKLNGNRRPTLDDLKESNTLVYEASVIWLVYNDVSTNKNSAKIYHAENPDETGIAEKRPIIELDWAKNKKSSFKGRSFNFFAPEYSKAIECDENISNRFSALIYES